MYKTGALIVNSSKLLLPALTAAARLVSGVLYVPLDYVGRVAGAIGAEGTVPDGPRERGEGPGVPRSAAKEDETWRIHRETNYLREASQQVSYNYITLVT